MRSSFDKLRTSGVLVTLALAFLALHLPYFPASLEDLDSINFALGVRRFDVAQHQPHPPGYTLFVLAAKMARTTTRSETTALALVSVVSGMLGVLAIGALFKRLDEGGGDSAGRVVGATALAMTAPLYWFTAARPLSDMPGLAAAVAVQALILSATTERALLVAAVLAGLAAGIRSQVVWLTAPLLVACACRPDLVADACRPDLIRSGETAGPIGPALQTQRGLKSCTTTVAAFAAGLLIWAIPLVALSGGPFAYWRAVVYQGTADFAGVRMLWTTPTPRVLLDALYYTLVAPWAVWPVAAIVLPLALGGAAVLMRTNRRGLAALAVAFGPYLVFDLLFQETETGRYALPVLIPIAFLAAQASRLVPRPVALAAGVALIAFDAHVGGRSIAAYARQPAPAFRLLADMRSASQSSGAPPVLAMDRREEFDLRRPFVWVGADAPAIARRLPSPPQHEWTEVVKYWNAGGRAPVWFVADPLRTDIDLMQHGPPAEYVWSLPHPVLMAGIRPNEMRWYRLERPEWYVDEGWALTPEAAGVADVDRRGLAHRPIQAWVRSDVAKDAAFVFGGRNFDTATPVRITVNAGERSVAALTAAPGFFVTLSRVALLADGAASSGDYVPVTVTAVPPARVSIEQFDISSARPVIGFGDGWHEQEYNPTTGLRWRWLSERGELRYMSPRPAVLHLEGESPRKYYNRDSRLVVRSGATVLHETQLSDDFAVDVTLPAAPEPSTVIVETDQTHTPAERSWRPTADRRHLGLRILTCELR